MKTLPNQQRNSVIRYAFHKVHNTNLQHTMPHPIVHGTFFSGFCLLARSCSTVSNLKKVLKNTDCCNFSSVRNIYMNSLLIFTIKKKHLYNENIQIHSVHTRFKTNLHPPIANLTKFQKGVYYSGIKIFNNLPHDIRDLVNEITLFRNALKRFLLINSF